MVVMSTRYKQFPSLANPSFSQTPVNQQILRNLKELYDEHSKNWDLGTRYAIIDHVLNGDTEVTERIAIMPSNHRLMNRNMTFAIWIVLRATYGLPRMARLQHRLFKQYPGIDPESLVSPLLKRETKSGTLEAANGTSQAFQHREPSIFGPVGVSQFNYQQQSVPPKRKQLEVVDHQPWKLSNKRIKNEEDTTTALSTAALSTSALSTTALSTTLRSPAFQRPSLLPAQAVHSATSVTCNTALPSIESPVGPGNSRQDAFHDPENEENLDPSLKTSLHNSEQALDSDQSVSAEMSGSHTNSSAVTHFTSLIQQNQDFNARLHELRSEVDQIKKERDFEHQGLIKMISSLREELRESTQGKVLAKASKVDNALTEYNNAARVLRTSLDSLAVQLDEKKDQEKPSQDLATTVHTMKSSMIAVETHFDPQQQKFQDNMKALGTVLGTMG